AAEKPLPQCTANVRFGPTADIHYSFDYLICDLLEMHRHVEAQRLGSLEVDDKLILRRRLYRHVGWFLSLEDAVDVAGRAAVLVEEIWAIRHQAAGGGKVLFKVNRRQLVSGCQCDDQIAVDRGRPARRHDQTAIRSAREGRYRALRLAGV